MNKEQGKRKKEKGKNSEHFFPFTFYFLLSTFLPAVCGCGLTEPEKAAAGGSQQQGPPPALVRVATVEKRSVPPRVIVVGSIVPKRTSIVASGVEGLVKEFPVEAGQFVQAGEVLSVLRMVDIDLQIAEAKATERERKQKLDELQSGSRPEEIAEAKANELSAEAIMKNAAAKLERAQRLFQQKAVNRDELDDAEEKAKAAQQSFLAAQAVFKRIEKGPRVEEIEQARARCDAQRERVAFLENEKEKHTAKAPFDGYIVREQTFVGQWLSKGDPVLTLAMLDEVDVVANVDQRDLCHVRPGQSADVRVTGSGQRGWKGTIVHIVPRSDWKTGSRGFPVKVRLTNDSVVVDGKRMPVLKEGMMAEVTFTGSPIDALLVPKDALVRTSRGAILYVFDPSKDDPQTGSVRQVIVELGISEGTKIQVIADDADDVAAGMQVVTEGAERLRPFQNVRIAPDAEQDAAKKGGPEKPPTP